MSSINSNFLDYSSLFSNTNTNTNTGNRNGSNMFDIIGAHNRVSQSGYGTNIARFTEQQAASVVNFKNHSAGLLNSLNNIMSKRNDGNNIFGVLKATSSNAEALTVSYRSDVDRFSSEALAARRDPNHVSAAPSNFAVKTLGLAQTQRNTSALNANEMALEAQRTYRFEISNGNETRTYAFVTENGDNNESIQRKIAAAINADSNSAVRASVSTTDAGESFLVIESKNTGLASGRNNAFEIRDISGYDAISRIGAGNVTQNARNAEFLIGEIDTARSTKDNIVLRGDAQLRTSMTNSIDIDSRTNITLRQTTDNYVAVNFERNTTESQNAVRDLVNNFNALYDLAYDNRSNSRAALLLNQLSGHAQTYINALHEIGISRNERGFLTIDEEKMRTAAENGRLEAFFSSDSGTGSYGFTTRLAGIAKRVNDNPAQYVRETNQTSSEGSTNAQNFWNDFNSGNSNYSRLYFNLQRYENMGALFNSMF
jgi:hypothetical protein